MMDIRGRFKDAPWFKWGQNMMCIVGGAGGIGSWLTLLLTRAGFNVTVFDFDSIEPHNLGGQFFGKTDIYKKKVTALKEHVRNFSDKTIKVVDGPYNRNSIANRYMFSAFDNMKARKDMFENWYHAYSSQEDAILIDGRLLMEQMQIFCVTPATAEEYAREHLFSDDEVEDEPCTLKQTSHSAALIASLMVGFFTNHIANIRNYDSARKVPFMHEYFIPLNLTTETNATAELQS